MKSVMQGVTLAEYAAVRCAQLEGYSSAEALSLEEISPIVWEADADAWDALVAEDAELDGPLAEALEGELDAARGRLARRVEPLESDFAAWVRFQRWWSAHPSPPLALGRVGLRERDVMRLHRLWSGRLAADEALRAQSMTLHAEDTPAEPPIVITRPRELEAAAARRRDGSWTLSAARQALVELRASKRLPAAAITSDAGDDESDDEGIDQAPAPLVAGAKPPPLVVPLPREERQPAQQPAPGLPTRSGTPVQAPAPIAREAVPPAPQAPAAAAAANLGTAIRPLVPVRSPPMVSSRAEDDGAQVTITASFAPIGGAVLPFVQSFPGLSPDHPPSRDALEVASPDDEAAQTLPVAPLRPGARDGVLPFVNEHHMVRDDAESTVLAPLSPLTEAVLPFQSAPTSPEPRTAKPPPGFAPDSATLLFQLPIAPPATIELALPSDDSAADPSGEAPRVESTSLAEYANLCAGVRAFPEHVVWLQNQYGMDAETWKLLHAIWRERFERDPALESEWQDLIERSLPHWTHNQIG